MDKQQRDDTEVAKVHLLDTNDEPIREQDGTPVIINLTATEYDMLQKMSRDENLTFEEAFIQVIDNFVDNEEQVEKMHDNADDATDDNESEWLSEGGALSDDHDE